MPYTRHFPLKLDYTNYEYYRVDKKNWKEFYKLKAELTKLSGKKKLIPDKKLKRFISLLEYIQGEETLHYLNTPIDESKLVYEYFNHDRYREKYLFSNKFRPMVTEVIRHLLYEDKKNELKKNRCIKLGIISIINYCVDDDNFSNEEIEKFNKYKICVIAACIADKVFDIRPRGKIGMMSEEEYFQFARPVCNILLLEKPKLFSFLKT